MPRWGITAENLDMLQERPPWGLTRVALEPAKVITDPVHGDIYLTTLERRIVDTWPMQRLRRVRQLGTTELVYPGATHSRFSHALGALRAAQDLLDAILDHSSGPRPLADYFGRLDPDERAFRKAEVTILARCGALVHDIGHVPFGHTIEDELQILKPHDKNVERFDRLWELLPPDLRAEMGEELQYELRGLALSKLNSDQFEVLESFASLNTRIPSALRPTFIEHALTSIRTALSDSEDCAGRTALGLVWRRIDKDLCLELAAELSKDEQTQLRAVSRIAVGHQLWGHKYPFVKDLVGNTICADLLDYIQRDHMTTGLPLALGHRFIEQFYVTNSETVYFPERVALRVTRDGRDRPDIISEVLKFLRYRYELSERALAHHAKLAADAMLAKLLAMYSDQLWVDHAVEEFGAEHIGLELSVDVRKLQEAIAQWSLKTSEPQGASVARCIELAIREDLETLFLLHGDSGLLEHLWGQCQARLGNTTEFPGQPRIVADGDRKRLGRWMAIAELTEGLLVRRLYKPIGYSSTRAVADSVFQRFSSPAERHSTEEAASDFAELPRSWEVVLWVPPPGMRLKAAEVLVNIDNTVAPLTDHDRIGAQRAQEIYSSHEALWRIAVYASPIVAKEPERVEVVLSKLQDAMGVPFATWRGEPVLPMANLIRDRIASNAGHLLARDAKILEVCRETVQTVAATREPGGKMFSALAEDAWEQCVERELLKRKRPPANFPYAAIKALGN